MCVYAYMHTCTRLHVHVFKYMHVNICVYTGYIQLKKVWETIWHIIKKNKMRISGSKINWKIIPFKIPGK